MNTTQFIASVKRAISVPTYQARYSDDDFLALANEEQGITVQPMLGSLRENYNMVEETIALVPGKSHYRIPKRATGRTIHMLEYYGQDLNGNPRIKLPQLKIEDSYLFNSQFTGGTPAGFVLEGDKIKIMPTPQQTGFIYVRYILQFSSLVKQTRTFTVQSVGDDTLTAVQTIIPGNINLIPDNNLVDITTHIPGYLPIVRDAVVTNISGTTITLAGFSSLDPLQAHEVTQYDIVSTAGETSIVQLPDELQNVLIHATAVRILEGLAIPDRLQQAQKILEKQIIAANMLMQPRVEGELQKVFSRNGLLRSRWGANRFPSISV